MHCTARYLLALALLSGLGCQEENRAAEEAAALALADAQDGSVELLGSYELVRRELPDGTVLEPPAIAGFMTYTRTHRHFHLYWPGAGGTPSSVSMAATYAIAGEEYSQTTLYEVVNNIPEGSGLDYNIPGASFATPIARRGQVVEFRDGESGPMLSFTGASMVATLEGEFVDRWVRVE